MRPEALKRGECAVCAHNILVRDLLCIDVNMVTLDLLRDDYLPEHTLPRSYDLELYSVPKV
ncbi:hypothetical protein BDR07DRAFT_1445626 [Suillus spraguei]|nr:hypothetical protein BDR07DRAFT_1445626 [Suillus spraguei]